MREATCVETQILIKWTYYVYSLYTAVYIIKTSVIKEGILKWKFYVSRICKKCLKELIQDSTLSQFPQTFLANPSKRRIDQCKISTVITGTPWSNVTRMCENSKKRGKNKGKLYTKECRLNKNTKKRKHVHLKL